MEQNTRDPPTQAHHRPRMLELKSFGGSTNVDMPTLVLWQFTCVLRLKPPCATYIAGVSSHCSQKRGLAWAGLPQNSRARHQNTDIEERVLRDWRLVRSGFRDEADAERQDDRRCVRARSLYRQSRTLRL